jgi:hypothetical protein
VANRFLSTQDEILNDLEQQLFQHGHPMQVGYRDNYVRLFLNARAIGGPYGDQIRDVMNARDTGNNEHARINVPALCEAWTAWWQLLDTALPIQLLTLGPREPFEDFDDERRRSGQA